MFLTNTNRSKYNTFFEVFFGGNAFYGIVLMILDHYQGQSKEHQLEASFTAKSPVD